MRPSESFIMQPIRSLQTMLRVLAEDDSSLPTVVPDGIYGPVTMQAVAAFQRKAGLPATGITDQKTWDAIVCEYEPALVRVDRAEPIEILMNAGEVFKAGDSSPYIFLLQSMLTQLSLDHPGITQPSHNGIMDEQTVAALSAFQRLSDLEVTGELDKISWKHIVLQFTSNAHHRNALRK